MGMTWPQGLFLYGQRPLMEGLSGGKFALGSIHYRQTAQGSGHLGMVRAKCFLCNFQCFLSYLGRLCIPPLLIKCLSLSI